MAVAYVTGSVGDATGLTTALAMTPGVLTTGGSAQATTSGNVLLVFASAFNNINNPVDLTSVTATGATFTETETITMSGSSQWQSSLFHAENITGQSTHTLTANIDQSSFTNGICAEFSGVPTSGSFHADGSASAVSTDPSGAGITPTVNGLHVFAVFHNDTAAFTAVAGWTEILNVSVDGASRMGLYTRAAVSGVLQTPSVTHAVSAQWAILHIVLAEPGGGSAPRPRYIGI